MTVTSPFPVRKWVQSAAVATVLCLAAASSLLVTVAAADRHQQHSDGAHPPQVFTQKTADAALAVHDGAAAAAAAAASVLLPSSSRGSAGAVVGGHNIGGGDKYAKRDAGSSGVLFDAVSEWSLYGFPFKSSVVSVPPRTIVVNASLSAQRRGFSQQGEEEEGEGNTETITTSSTSEEVPFTQTIYFVIVADFLLLCGCALFAGLTLAVMGLDTLSLEIIASSGAEPDKTYAARILPLRRKGNQLLSTLVLGNVMVNTLIAQVTDSYAKGWVATLISTVLITVGGEIVPQALMSAHALKIGSMSSPIVKFFMILFYPICKPVAMFLNYVIGSDPGQIYNRNELKRLMIKHFAHSTESGVDKMDLELMVGAIDLKDKSVVEVLTPLADVYMLEANRRLNEDLLQQVAEKGHSRIPVYAKTRNNVIGVLHAKDLLLANPEDNTRIGDLVMFYQRKFHTVPSETKLYSMLRYFQTGTSHIALVQEVSSTATGDPFYSIKGIVTLEDVMEELLQREILDEHDVEAAAAAPNDGTSMIGIDGSGAAAAHNQLNMKLIARKNASRTQRRIHLSSNQLTACALFLQRSLPEFKGVDEHLLASLIGHNSTVYKIRPPTDATGLSWGDANNVMLYGPPSASSSSSAAAASIGFSSASENTNNGGGAAAGGLLTAFDHCATIMTLIISGRAEVSPCALAGNGGGAAAAKSSSSGYGADDISPVDSSVVAELPSWSLVNVAGMRDGLSAAGGGNATHNNSGNATKKKNTIDYYCRVVSEALVMQISHVQYRVMVAALKKVAAVPPLQK